MEYNNKFIELAKKTGGIDRETLEVIAVLLSPFAPHFAEEMWEQLGHQETVFRAGWPTCDEAEMKEDEIEIPVQINGKTKAIISVSAGADKNAGINLNTSKSFLQYLIHGFRYFSRNRRLLFTGQECALAAHSVGT